MAATVLTLVQDACAELGLPIPGTVFGATDQQTVQMRALLNAVGKDLLTRFEWTALQKRAVINVAAPLTGTGTVVEGLNIITTTGVDVSQMTTPSNWVVSGTYVPTSARATLVAGNTSSGVINIDMEASGDGTGAIVVGRDTYDVPADFVSFINDTQWDVGNHWRLQGPSTPQEDEWMRSGIVTVGPRRWFRQVGRGLDVFRLWPPPGTNDVPGPLVYEYLSKYWAEDASGTELPQFSADTDTCIYDDRLMIEGLKWRFYAAKGFDYSAQFAIWNRELQVAMGRDGGRKKLNMMGRRYRILMSPAQVQDGYYPGPGNP